MKRRLRKKKRLGEFQELGFEVTYSLAQGASPEVRGSFLAGFLEEAIEANDLIASGGGGAPSEFFVVSAKRRGSATNEQRNVVSEWLGKNSSIVAFNVGPLRDARHGWDE